MGANFWFCTWTWHWYRWLRCRQPEYQEPWLQNMYKVVHSTVIFGVSWSSLQCSHNFEIHSGTMCAASISNVWYKRDCDLLGDRNPVLDGIKVDSNTRCWVIFEQGWAARPKTGMPMGINFVGPFQSLIQESFHRGEDDKFQKMNAPRMAQEIIRRFPHRYDVHSVYHITSLLTALMASAKAAPWLKKVTPSSG